MFWFQVRNNALEYKFRRQFSIDRFITDFYCNRLRLIVEIDGINHESEKTQQYDKQRQERLEDLGYTVIRYTDEEVLCDTESVVRHLLQTIESLTHRDPLRVTPPNLP